MMAISASLGWVRRETERLRRTMKDGDRCDPPIELSLPQFRTTFWDGRDATAGQRSPAPYGLRSGDHLPRRGSARRHARSHVADCTIPEIEIGLQLGDRELLPFIGLPQQRTALVGTESGGSPVQRSDGAVFAHVFHDSFPRCRHELSPRFACGHFENGPQRFSIR
jgi:hypothetical protein